MSGCFQAINTGGNDTAFAFRELLIGAAKEAFLTDDLVIAAHNYRNHFGRLKELAVGDSVTFTDMEGIVNTYRVEKVETLQPTEVAAVQNSGHDLVLYTCTKGGKTRVTVFCDRAEEKE